MFCTHLKIQTQFWMANATSVCDYLGSKYRALAWKWRLGRVSTSAPRSGAHHDHRVRTSEEVLTSLLVLLRIYHTVGADKSLMGEAGGIIPGQGQQHARLAPRPGQAQRAPAGPC